MGRYQTYQRRASAALTAFQPQVVNLFTFNLAAPTAFLLMAALPYVAQRWNLPVASTVTLARAKVGRNAAFTGALWFEVWTEVAGQPGAMLAAVGPMPAASIPIAGAVVSFPGCSLPLAGGVALWLVVRASGFGGGGTVFVYRQDPAPEAWNVWFVGSPVPIWSGPRTNRRYALAVDGLLT